MNDLLTEGSIVFFSGKLFTITYMEDKYINGEYISVSTLINGEVLVKQHTDLLTNATDLIRISLYKDKISIYSASYLVNKKVIQLLKEKKQYKCKLHTLEIKCININYLSINFNNYSYAIPVSDNFVSYYKMCDKFYFNKL